MKMRHLRHPLSTARHAALLFRLHGEAVRRGLEGRQYYNGDTRFHLDVVVKGFSDRRESGQCDKHLLSRICKAYQAASSVSASKLYEPTDWWMTLRRGSLRPVLAALQTDDVHALQQMYANFFRDPCSDGLVGKSALLAPTLPRSLVRFHQLAYLSEALSRLDRWKNLTHGMYCPGDLRGPALGNPFGIVLDDVFIYSGAEHQHYGAQRIANILNQRTKAVVAEIGGGYGAMAYYLLRGHSRITYYNFDLPESLALSAYYLLRSFPEKRILLYGEAPERGMIVDDYHIVLMPLTALATMPPRFADLIFSAHAMSDLTGEVLKIYLEMVKQRTSRYFLYQGMYSAAKKLERLILDDSSGLELKEKKRYHLHGREGEDSLQCELLYELSCPQ